MKNLKTATKEEMRKEIAWLSGQLTYGALTHEEKIPIFNELKTIENEFNYKEATQ